MMRSLFYICVFNIVVLFASAQNSALQFTKLTVDDGLSQNTVQTIAKDKYGFMWFGTWEGISRYDGYTFKIFRADTDNPNALSNNRINAIVTDAEGKIWVQTEDYQHLFIFDYQTELFRKMEAAKAPETVHKILRSYKKQKKSATYKNLSFQITSKGLLRTDRFTNSSILITPDKHSSFAMNDEDLNVLFVDSVNHILWVGTQNGGINYSMLDDTFFRFYSIETATSLRSGSVVRTICEDKSGKLWVGTASDGIVVMDKDRNQVISTFSKKQLIHPDIRSVYCDRYGLVWIGTKGGLDCYNPQTKNIRHYYPKQKGSIPHAWVFSFMEDHQGNLWVGTFGGFARYNRQNDCFVNYQTAGLLKSPKVRMMLEDKNRNFWIATEGGGVSCLTNILSHESQTRTEVLHYRHVPGKENSLISDLVLALAEDEKGRIWIGTNGGLCVLEPAKAKIIRFSVKTGFPDDLIMGLLTDKKGHIWISHKKGLTRMNIEDFTFRTFNRYDGLQSDEFAQNAYYCNQQTREMFFGGINGFSAFYPDKIKVDTRIPKVLFTGLKVMNQTIEPSKPYNGKVLLPQSLLLTPKIVLARENNGFSLQFSSLNYRNPRSSRFRYQLEGIDKQWIYTDASMREAIYTYLPTGSYTFKVEASNGDGNWTGKPGTIEIEILPPWWLSWWSKLLYAIVLVLMGWLAYKYLMFRIEVKKQLLIERLKNEQREELMNVKMNFFTSISHEFRTPLTLLIDPLNKLKSGMVNPEKIPQYYDLMSRNASQLLDLVNQLLDFRKLQSKSLPFRPTRSNFISFIKTIASSFENQAEESHINFVVKSELPELEVDFDAEKLRMVLNNLISNAFKFTNKGGEITVSVTLPEVDTVVFEVTDNGKGIAFEHLDKIFELFYQVDDKHFAHAGSGIGLALTRELIELHGGSIAVVSQPDNGTSFTVRIPRYQKEAQSVVNVFSDIEPQKSEPQTTKPSFRYSEEQNTLPFLLIVDDNKDIREYIQLNFSDQYQVIMAENGIEGFEKATVVVPDIVVSDVMMPGLSGLELCHQLKTDERTSHIPVILLTARQSDESKVEGYETGADAYVTKPFSTDVLSSQIKNLLEQRIKLRRLFSKDTIEPRKVAVNITDEAFLNKTLKLIYAHLEETNFDPDKLSELLNLSRSQLYRKIKALTDLTVHDFIVTARMTKAKEYLLEGDLTISEIAYKVGYSLPTNFSRTFTRHFGVSPSKFIEMHKSK